MKSFNLRTGASIAIVSLFVVGCSAEQSARLSTDESPGLTVIDAHAHTFGVRDVQKFGRDMEAADLSGISILCIALKERSMFMGPEALLLKAAHPDKVWVFGGLIYDPPGGLPEDFSLARQAEMLWNAGFDGVKMIEGKANFRAEVGFGVNDPRYDEYFTFLQERGIPLLLHQNDDWTHWRDANDMNVPEWLRRRGYFLKAESFPGGKIPAHEQLYSESEQMLRKFPKLKIIFAHFYFISNDIARARRFMERHGDNVCVDLAPAESMYYDFAQDPGAWRNFFVRYQDRIVFGTDAGALGTPTPDIETTGWIRRFLETRDEFEYKKVMKSKPVTYRFQIRGIGLDREPLAKIYAGNFQRLVGSKPRPLNFDKALEYCGYLERFAKASENRDKLVPKIRKIMGQLDLLRGEQVNGR